MLHQSSAAARIKKLIPAGIRTTGSRSLAQRAYHQFLKQKFAGSYQPVDPGPAPAPDVVVKTNAKTKDAFQRSFGNSQVGANIYMTTGYNNAHLFLRRLEEYGFDFGDFGTVFELGCGDGRILRHFRNISGLKLVGSDTRDETVAWCKENLPGASYFKNEFEPPLAFLDANSVDLAYAFSVFTHIPLASQNAWLEEMVRVLRPGGFFLVTVMGNSLKESLSEKRQAELAQKGEVEITSNDDDAHLATQLGGSLWDVYQSRERIIEVFGSVFKVLDYLPDGLSKNPGGKRDLPALGQDLVILQKPPT